ncbi:MAG: peptidoglycan editing factor PgeF [Deltaproteobacteria bacterium]|nr:MAG: peptidoglycan editing factor PgeF [Deltaproteobacteria bacterium]
MIKNLKKIKSEKLAFLFADNLKNDKIHHGFSTRFNHYNEADYLIVHQIHSDNILIIDSPIDLPFSSFRDYEADGIITNQPRIPIAIRTADCIPLLLFDHKKKIIAAIHAGWKGVGKNIVGKAVKKMQEVFKTCPSDILAAIGPCIRGCCYEVDNRVKNLFEQNGIKWQEYSYKSRVGHFFIDLLTIVIDQLLDANLNLKNIQTFSICTSCHVDIFFSYRKEGGIFGEQLNFIELA